MNWLAAVINRVNNTSSVSGKAACPVWSQPLTSPSVVKSPNAIAPLAHQDSRSIDCQRAATKCPLADELQSTRMVENVYGARDPGRYPERAGEASGSADTNARLVSRFRCL